MKMIRGSNIKLARESRKMSQKDLADLIGVTQATLSKMEKEVLTVNNNLLPILSSTLHYSQSFFQLDFVQSENDSLFYRKRKTMSAKDIYAINSKKQIFNGNIDSLLKSIEIPNLNLPSIEVSETKTPEAIAFDVRRIMNIPLGPVVDIVSKFERNGIVVVFWDIDIDKFDGLTTLTSKDTPVICINKKMPNDRKRFSLAHELGHLIMHLRNLNSFSKDEDELEQEADRFASEFLMPEEKCKYDFFHLKWKDLPLKKQYWKVSKAAIIYRAHSLGCISDEQKKAFYTMLSKSGEKTNELGIVEIDQPRIIRRMLELHISELNYSLDDLSTITGLIPEEINSMMEIRSDMKVIRLNLD